ncbi:MAG: DNA repair protein RecO [Pseudanabaena sp. M158S2SP1A06QC]|nr:DNA repair protein RecO [Pseudanabaena sp. M53BS1SP1A06MG]MCA6582922.1 DNA repair protein RecO [Pseudanabaena sp. M34BS1SP1A06MG]MCA6584826.1 DNA repair protein RecO [Pseudanabaena sp. M051S1SP1A06QC]MCA6590960.1 DNA repair protein RecO [Pseudanabaena sp. M38BS1SP1A06MG]MCA6598900.1 DNA repair protein RecO [Pseudanabaena sp. M57BS1SP1A06MG]MCA6610543.1 DNA repair protein RecO [Pseudanabaena sp. M158S2SP1A06QC]MCA6622290.1 DNA repair protein RecO [Pseudanabaena sp. M165S2SP1A06QC]
MPKEYQAIGINLKGMPLGEHDRLLTILTKECGLIKAVATGARKHRSAMAGRSGLFVVNDLQISVGRSMDRIKNAEMLQSFVGLGKTLAKLTAAQYLSELALMQALSAQPQEELFLVLVEHLNRIQDAEDKYVLACLVHGTYHLLAIAGFAPQVHSCCISQRPVIANREIPKWKAGFSIVGGGVINLEITDPPSDGNPNRDRSINGLEIIGNSAITNQISHYLNAPELLAIQELAQTDLTDNILKSQTTDWLTVERLLRAYAQYHFDRPIQSSALIDNCFFNI